MFVGHIAAGLLAKRIEPSLSLGWYVAAGSTLDLLWPLFLLAGIERVRIVPGAMPFNPLVFDAYPWSHSLVMAIVWGVVLALLARWRGARARAAAVVGATVVSHWLLDVVTHAPDMPLWPGASPKLGLGLWNSVPGTFAVEGLLWVAAIALYLQRHAPRGWSARVGFWSLVGLSTVMWIASPGSPPPPDTRSLALFALMGWLIVPWAAWADRSRAAS
jgi:membrane-bound metal-dependent hydrolase YbcI (DUF457 family)